MGQIFLNIHSGLKLNEMYEETLSLWWQSKNIWKEIGNIWEI